MEEIRQEEAAQKAAGSVSVWRLFLTRSLRWQLASIICLMAGQQLSGVNAVRGAGWTAVPGDVLCSDPGPSCSLAPLQPRPCLPDLLLRQ